MEEYESLVIRSQTGNIEAYCNLIKRFQDMAYGYSFSLLGDFHLAQDAAQEAFVEAYRNLQQLQKPSAFPGWFRRVVFKHCDRFIRVKHLSTVPIEKASEIASRQPGPADLIEQKQMKDQVINAIKALPEQMRTTTSLYYINGYSQKEIADFLEVPVKTIKSRLYGSRKRLKERMTGMVEKTMKSLPLSGDFTEIVVRKVTSDKDLEGARKFLASGYFGKRQKENFKTIEAAQKANIYVVTEKGNAESAGYYDEIDWSISKTVLKAVRVREMAGEANGVPDKVFVKGFRGCFKMAGKQGCTLSVAHGSMFDHGFCDFVPCFYHPVATLPAERAREISVPSRVREVRNEKESQEGWQAFLRDPYAAKIGGWAPRRITHVVERESAQKGYMSWNKNWYGNWYCATLTVQDRESALAILKFIAEQKDEKEIMVQESHMTHPTRAILSLGGKYLLRPACDLVGLDNEMVAIIDLVGLTQQLEAEFRSRFMTSEAYSMKGNLSIEMDNEIVGFTVHEGCFEIVTEKQKAHCVLPRWVVTRLYMGYYSGEDVLAMGPIPWDRSDGKNPDNPKLDIHSISLPKNEAVLFKMLFPRLWPSSLPDPDVWPWVIGESHPKYQHEDVKSPEMKAQIDALRFPWIGY